MMNKFKIVLASLIALASLVAIASASERKEITLVEYWAPWNQENEITYLDSLKNVKVSRVDVDENIELLIDHNIVVLPTLIFYVDGKEVKRIEGDLSFTLKLTRGEVQKVIEDFNIPLKK